VENIDRFGKLKIIGLDKAFLKSHRVFIGLIKLTLYFQIKSIKKAGDG